VAKFTVPKTLQREIPVKVGSQMASSYVFGHNPRKQAYSGFHEPAFGVKQKPLRLGSSAPHKTELDAFESKHGFVGGFGRTGMTGES